MDHYTPRQRADMLVAPLSGGTPQPLADPGALYTALETFEVTDADVVANEHRLIDWTFPDGSTNQSLPAGNKITLYGLTAHTGALTPYDNSFELIVDCVETSNTGQEVSPLAIAWLWGTGFIMADKFGASNVSAYHWILTITGPRGRYRVKAQPGMVPGATDPGLDVFLGLRAFISDGEAAEAITRERIHRECTVPSFESDGTYLFSARSKLPLVQTVQNQRIWTSKQVETLVAEDATLEYNVFGGPWLGQMVAEGSAAGNLTAAVYNNDHTLPALGTGLLVDAQTARVAQARLIEPGRINHQRFELTNNVAEETLHHRITLASPTV